MSDWVDAAEVIRRLKLKPQTLYAYVSRGRIEAKPDDKDTRRRLYRAADVARLEHRKARGRRDTVIAEDAIAWGEPILNSGITTVSQGRLWYRGQDAEILAESQRLEDVARLLWANGEARFPPQQNGALPGSARQRMFAAVANRAATDPILGSRAPRAVYLEAASLLDGVVDAVAGGPGEGPIHDRLARAWSCDAAGADLIRRALVLLADHELNASTFAVRVTASTRASLAACALAGLAALSGPLHGGMSIRVQALIEEARRNGAQAAVATRVGSGAAVPGFGHPLYPDGDPRARSMLSAFSVPPIYGEVQRACEELAGHCPNIDFALAAMVQRLGLPDDAPFQIFATARCTGWIAHAIEQSQIGRLIRPRARYIGPEPDVR